MRVHVLKTLDYVWDAVASGAKRWEVRKNDRGFQSGDTVVLRKLRPNGIDEDKTLDDTHKAGAVVIGHWCFRDLRFRIGWMLQGGQFGIEPGYCVFNLEPEVPE